MNGFSFRDVLTSLLIPLPITMSFLFLFTSNPLYPAAAVITLFLLVAFLPFCKRRENLWMFVLSSFALLPANIRTVLMLTKSDLFFFTDSGLLYTLTFLLILGTEYCTEQLILAVITRLIWQRQYNVKKINH